MKFSIYKLYEPFDLTQYKNTRFMYNPNTKQIILGSFHDDVYKDSHADLYYTAIGGNKGYDNFYIKGWLGFAGRKYQKGIIHFAPNIRPEQSEVVMQAITLIEKLKNHGFTDNTWVRGLVRFDEYKIKDMYEKIQNWEDDVKPYRQQLQDWVNCSFVKDKVYKIAEGVYTSDKMKARYHNSDLKPYFLLIDSPFYSNGKLTESFSNLSKKGFNGIIQGKTFRVFNESEQVKEANAQKDNEVRNKNKQVFDILQRTIKKTPNFGKLIGTEHGFGYFANITQAVEMFYPEYKDNKKKLYLLIGVRDDSTVGAFERFDDFNLIKLNILSEDVANELANTIDSKKSKQNQLIKQYVWTALMNAENTFLHEFTHAIDDYRMKNYKGRWKSQVNQSNTDYLNDPLEFNAWFQSTIQEFDGIQTLEKDFGKNWNTFYSYVLDCLPFVKEYDEKYRRKFDVRLWKYWNEFIKEGSDKKQVNEAKFNYGNLYHGTNASFDVFNKEYITGGYLGKGFYFTMSKNMAKNYGENVIEAKLNYNNSFMFDSDILNDNSLIKILDTSNANNTIKKDIFNQYKNLVNGYSIYEANSKLFDIMDFYKGDTTKILKELGYDSIDNIERDSEFLVFEPAQIKIIKQVNESLKNEGGFFITSSGRDILNLLKNKPKEYRIVYDANLKLFMICDANEGIHQDMLEKAYNNGLYYNLEDFIDSLGSFQNYIETGQDGGWNADDEEIESYLYYMIFDPTGQWEVGDDEYDTVYKLPFGNLFTRKCDLSEIPFYNMLPLTEQLNEYDEFDSDDDFWKQDDPEFNDNFWKWFNGSKVVDEDGSPLIVYHGTASKFDVFGDSKFGDYGKGYYFVDSKLKANEYAIRSGGNVIMSAYLSIKNPYIARSSSESQLRSDIGEKFTKDGLPIKKEKITEILSQNGYDGVIIPIGEQPFGFNYYLCFNKNQIKSVDNNGNWSSASDNVNEVIEEGINDNYLYHAMWKKQFLRCKKDNRLYSHTAYENYKTTHRTIKGISTSRNLNVCIKFMERAIKEMTDEWKKDPNSYFLMNDTGNDGTTHYIDKGVDLSYVVLVFDRNKLKQNHKIIPHSYLAGGMRDSFGDEQEELVVGDIPNFMNYVVDVIEFNNNVNSKTLKSKKNVIESSEPKLNDNFWKWFRGSKIINKDGTPHLCYHYSPNKFNTFDINRKIDNGYFGNGIYFTGMTGWGYSFGRNKYECYIRITNPLNFELFEESNYDAESLLEYLKQYEDESYPIILQKDYDDYNEYSKAEGIKSYDLTFSKIHHGLLEPYGEYITQYAKDMGYDGIISDSGYTEIVVFEPNQIKSVDNNGDWSFTSDNINESIAPKLNDNFWKWFDGSKIVDKKGNPLVCYHETNVDFNSFDISKQSHAANLGYGFYFSSEPFWSNLNVDMKYRKECYLRIKNPFDASKRYTIEEVKFLFDNEVYNDIIKNSKLKGKYTLYNLFCDAISYLFYESEKYNGIDDKQWYKMIYNNFQKAGYDGIKRKDSEYGLYEYIVFNPNQIKSVNNNGNWSSTSNNINESNEPKLNQNFWKWFGDSVCVDDTGAPKILYHGTSSDFKEFKTDLIFTCDDKNVASEYGSLGAMPVFVKMSKPFIVDAFNQSFDKIYNAEGFKKKYKDLTEEDYQKLFKTYNYFESLEDCKAYYEESKKYNPDDYINMARAYGQKPRSTNGWANYAKSKGYDGCIIKNVQDTVDISNKTVNEYIVWNSNQIKSVNNNGDWSEKDDIYESSNLNDNFWVWFRGSKIIDKDGKPLIVYHGSPYNFDNFDNSKIGTSTKKYEKEYHKSAQQGFFFSLDKDYIKGYGDKTYACYLKMVNPYIYDMNDYIASDDKLNEILEYAKSNGYDGVVFKNIREIGSSKTTEFVVFDSNQIKIINKNDIFESWWSGGVNWQNDREGLGGVGATQDCHLFFFMFPDQFLNLCPKFSYGDEKFFNQYVNSRKPLGIPFLWCEVDEKNKTLKVLDHEGRHRVQAIRDYAISNGKSQPDIPVAIIYNKDKYNLPSDIVELRKNWKIVSQKSDTIYNVGQFTVQNNLDNTRVGADNLYESIKSLYSNSSTKIITTDSECANWIKNNPNNRLMYDTNKKWYIVSNNINDDIHIFMIEDAIRDGYYPEFIEKYGKRLNHDVMGEVGTEIINRNPDRFLLLRGLTKDNEELMTDGYQDKYDCGDFFIFSIKNEFEKLPIYKYFKAKLTESQEPKLNQNFWNWFKGSKTVDEQGNPLIFYHGTKQLNITNFKAKYDDGLVFFAYNEEFAKEWASNAPLTPDQEQGVRDFNSSDDLANYRKEVMARYKRDYGDNWADDEDLVKSAKWEIKEYENQRYKQMGIEENVIPVYIRATKIFNPEKDYNKVIKEIAKHWELDLTSDYKKEYDEAKSEYEKVSNIIHKWFEEHKDFRNDTAMAVEFQKREDILTNAFNKFNEVRQKIETRNNHLKRIMSGAWIYFENQETINKIWELGYDAIELSEHSGVITTLAVREGTNQVKSIFNFGNWGSDTNIFENKI